jgi:hypothetical protein
LDPAQAPPEQTSVCVQAFPSLQGSWLFVCVHCPDPWSQPSVVHTFWSSQSSTEQPKHFPAPPARKSDRISACESARE